MTNHIEEMMKTAEINGNYNYFVEEKTLNIPRLDKHVVDKYEIRHINFGLGYYKVWSVRKEYPDFTAEKQLEIIKLIGLERGFKIIPNEGYDYMLSEDTYAKYELNKQGYSMTDFTQALANLTTELMNAGDLDKEKVKGILEG